MSLTIPTTHTPPWTLLALALFQGVEVKWDPLAGEKGHISYNGIEGTEAVRAELEKNIPGKEVCAFRLVPTSPPGVCSTT
jgi:glutamyl-tRNA synthetase